MSRKGNVMLQVMTTVAFDIETVWHKWNDPHHIRHWYFASDDWYVTHVRNHLEAGGELVIGMAARDGSVAFDFKGVYDEVVEFDRLSMTLDDGRIIQIQFVDDGDNIMIKERFEPDEETAPELQQEGWQNIIDSFKRYCEQ